MLSDFVSLLFPQNCINCNRSLITQEQFICTYCKVDLPFTDDHQHLLNNLYQKFAFEKKVLTANAYLFFHPGGITQKLLHQIKYKGKKELAKMLGNWHAEFLSTETDCIIPVPLHTSKLAKRGYNQSYYYGLGISEILRVEIQDSLVTRERFTTTQTRKTKVERWVNLENVYSTIESDLTGVRVLVVDDVITTGATVGMLCDRLVEAGVEEIHIACIARQ